VAQPWPPRRGTELSGGRIRCETRRGPRYEACYRTQLLDQLQGGTRVSTTMQNVSIGKKPAPVVLTDIATTKVAELLAQEDTNDLALRVAVRPGGCSGYSYEMFFDAEVADDDIVREFGTVKVVVDSASADLLKGSTLDYSDGLQGAGFHVTNPNAARTCGCGSSFS
jgi:iron-sulfur cluster assembly accessory protein